jgi:hypothetical protein
MSSNIKDLHEIYVKKSSLISIMSLGPRDQFSPSLVINCVLNPCDHASIIPSDQVTLGPLTKVTIGPCNYSF